MLKCPSCKKEMKENEKHSGIYACKTEDCKDKYVLVPQSIFGVS